MFKRIFTIVGLSVMLTACGTTPQERGVSGAGVGAGAGAIVGAVTGLSVIQGAVLGAVAGGLTGALTDENQVNLGDPAWKSGSNTASHQTVAHSSPSVTGKQVVVDIQKGLKDMGYNPGVTDGINGPKTQEAIRKYQKDHGLIVDGQATPALLDHIKQQHS